MDTIAACATPLVKGGAVSIIRVSGENALRAARAVFAANGIDWDNAEPRKMYLGVLTAEHIKDKAFCVYYKAPLSYTGEDVIELQTHGGLSIVNGVLKRLFSLGVRPAAAGEFTKRAYLNGKLSLAEAEGICDLINAQSEAAAMQAYRLMTGELSQGIRAAAELLLSAEANIEAVLDYPEELADDLKEPTLRLLCQAREKLSDLLSSSQNARYLNEGVNIVIAGAPNAGKSSLLNAILKDDRAIVAETAGTTRDTLRETVEIEGIRVNITDTAGIRKSGDTLEKMGIERAKKAALGADLVVFLTDLSREESHEDADFLRSLAGKTVIIAGNKGDIARFQRQADIVIEAKNGKNVDKLLSLIAKRLDLHVAAQGAILIKERHISKVREAMAAAQSAIEGYTITPPDCTAADVKAAHRALTDVIGTDADESVVDKIFAEFCVGK